MKRPARIASILSLTLILSVLLAACAVTIQPGGSIEFESTDVGGASIDDRLGLRAYPGSTITRQERGRRSSQTSFETGASLESVYAHFDRQITAAGWRRSEVEMRPNRVEAEYRRGDDEVDFELIRQGRSGGYRLEIEFDD